MGQKPAAIDKEAGSKPQQISQSVVNALLVIRLFRRSGGPAAILRRTLPDAVETYEAPTGHRLIQCMSSHNIHRPSRFANPHSVRQTIWIQLVVHLFDVCI